LLSNTEQPAELLGLARTLSSLKPALNRPSNVLTAFHKFAAATRLSRDGIRVPDALLTLDPGTLNDDRGWFGAQAVYKTAIGTHGGGTWLVDRDERVNPMVGHRYAFLQELLDTAPGDRNRDLRVYVVGDTVLGAMSRYAPETDWRTNVALGGDVEGVQPDDLPDEAATMALDAARAIGLDYAGVDLIEGPDGLYVLEVNPTAGFRGLFRVTARSPAPHIAALGIERAGGTVDADQVAAIEDDLDDSEPNCVAGTGTSNRPNRGPSATPRRCSSRAPRAPNGSSPSRTPAPPGRASTPRSPRRSAPARSRA